MIEAAVAKLKRTFEVSPWLKTSKLPVNMPIGDPDCDPKKPKSLPQLTWIELHAMMEKLS